MNNSFKIRVKLPRLPYFKMTDVAVSVCTLSKRGDRDLLEIRLTSRIFLFLNSNQTSIVCEKVQALRRLLGAIAFQGQVKDLEIGFRLILKAKDFRFPCVNIQGVNESCFQDSSGLVFDLTLTDSCGGEGIVADPKYIYGEETNSFELYSLEDSFAEEEWHTYSDHKIEWGDLYLSKENSPYHKASLFVPFYEPMRMIHSGVGITIIDSNGGIQMGINPVKGATSFPVQNGLPPLWTQDLFCPYWFYNHDEYISSVVEFPCDVKVKVFQGDKQLSLADVLYCDFFSFFGTFDSDFPKKWDVYAPIEKSQQAYPFPMDAGESIDCDKLYGFEKTTNEQETLSTQMEQGLFLRFNRLNCCESTISYFSPLFIKNNSKEDNTPNENWSPSFEFKKKEFLPVIPVDLFQLLKWIIDIDYLISIDEGGLDFTDVITEIKEHFFVFFRNVEEIHYVESQSDPLFLHRFIGCLNSAGEFVDPTESELVDEVVASQDLGEDEIKRFRKYFLPPKYKGTKVFVIF